MSKNLVNYVWNVLISTQRGYGFNKSHTLAYSIVGLQELNLAYKYNPIFWTCANLIVDSGSLDEDVNDATNYGKMAMAISSAQKEGVAITNPLINEAEFGFAPDVNNDRIIFGLKGINGINTDISKQIIANRPYKSMEHFADIFLDQHFTGNYDEKGKPIMKPSIIKPAQMVMLIKAGCFTELHHPDRQKTLEWYLQNYVYSPTKKLTMTHFNKLVEKHLVPNGLIDTVRVKQLVDYILDDEGFYQYYIDPNKKPLKRGYHDRYYILDEISQPKYQMFFTENPIVGTEHGYFIVSEKLLLKEAESYLDAFKTWMSSPNTLNDYNLSCFLDVWEKYATGNEAKWSMQALTYYDNEHELEYLDEDYYGIVNFFDLPEEPEAYDYYTRYINGEAKRFPKYKISRIAGTVLNADNNHHVVSLLTKYGVVNVKVNKGKYAFYNKRITSTDENGNNSVIEEPWFKRGTLLMVCGIRREDQFFPTIYQETIYKHTINRILEVDGTKAVVQVERANG